MSTVIHLSYSSKSKIINFVHFSKLRVFIVRLDVPLYLVLYTNGMDVFQYAFGCHIFTFECMYFNEMCFWMSTLEYIWMHEKVKMCLKKVWLECLYSNGEWCFYWGLFKKLCIAVQNIDNQMSNCIVLEKYSNWIGDPNAPIIFQFLPDKEFYCCDFNLIFCYIV